MELVLLLVLLFLVFVLPKISVNKKLNNYDMSKVDGSKLSWDAANGVSVDERRRRVVSGYYDKDKK